ncbi:hypothetical protein STEG23_035976, partial [Scotinomys teguina]
NILPDSPEKTKSRYGNHSGYQAYGNHSGYQVYGNHSGYQVYGNHSGYQVAHNEEEEEEAQRPILESLGQSVEPVRITMEYSSSGKATGEADVHFDTHEDAVAAMLKDRSHVQHSISASGFNSTVMTCLSDPKVRRASFIGSNLKPCFDSCRV